MTADELLHLRDDGWRHELIRGELKRMPFKGVERGLIVVDIAVNLDGFARARRLGEVLAGTGFWVERDPDTVLAPDVAFIRAKRSVRTTGYFEGPPDAAFEIVEDDEPHDIAEKTREWLSAGCRAVVIVDPKTKSVRIHRVSGAIDATDAIEIDDVVPGWRMPLSEVFD